MSAEISTVELAEALRHWHRSAGPYWMYVCAAPFLRAVPRPGGRGGGSTGGRAVVNAIMVLPPGETPAVFVDSSPVPALSVAGQLSRLGYHVVPVVQRFCASPAVVRSERLAEALVDAAADVFPPSPARGVVFLLDGDRLGPRRRGATTTGGEPSPSLFDNRHEYPVDRFPPPELLLRQGITTVYWVGGEGIAPDLQEYARRLAGAGLPPQIVAPRRG